MTALGGREGVAARALEITILNAARTSEVIGATWDEIDLVAKIWIVPADRIKGGKEHRVCFGVGFGSRSAPESPFPHQ